MLNHVHSTPHGLHGIKRGKVIIIRSAIYLQMLDDFRHAFGLTADQRQAFSLKGGFYSLKIILKRTGIGRHANNIQRLVHFMGH